MTDSDFKGAYDDEGFPPLAATVDVALFSISKTTLSVALVERKEQPAKGRQALPGAFFRPREELEDAAARVLRDRLNVAAPVRQFHTFAGIRRDPRLRTIAIAYMAALPIDHGDGIGNGRFVEVRNGVAVDGEGPLDLPFDHAQMIAAAIADMQLNLDVSDWVFNFLPELFSLRELQQVHEAIRGRPVNKPAFRKRMIQTGWLEETGIMEQGKGFRPAELYRAREVRVRKK